MKLIRGPPESFSKAIPTLSDEELRFDHAIIHSWFESLLRGDVERVPEDYRDLSVLKKLHDEIAAEMTKRGMTHDSPIEFATPRSVNKQGPPVELSDVLRHFEKPIVLRKGFIRLVGGLVNHGKTEGDIDILIALPPDTPDSVVHPIRFRIGRLLPEDLAKRIHFLLDEYHGPFTNFIDLYDLVLVPTRHELIFMESPEAEAKRSRDEDRVEPLRFFYPLKATRSETIDSVLEWFREQDYPLYAQKKYDGLRIIWMKKGNEVKAITEQGQDVTERFPTLVEKLRQLPVGAIVLDSEVEGWTGTEHWGREEISGYVNAKTPPDDRFVVANVFDVLYVDMPKHHEIGKGDVHDLPYSERYRILEKISSLGTWTETDKIPPTPGFNLVPNHVIEKPDRGRLEKIWSTLRDLPGSEGMILKSAHSTYPLTGSTRLWLKVKKYADAHAVVVERLPTKTPGVYRYRIGLLIPPDWEVPEEQTATVHLKNKRRVPVAIVGKTFNTTKKLNPGDIVEVSFHTAFLYERGDKKWMTIYEPRITGVRPDQVLPDSLNDLLRLADKSNILQIKHAQLPPMDDEPHDFVLQHHYRGRSVHADLRIRVNDHLVGWTINDQKPDALEEPVHDLRTAKRLERERWDEIFKLSNKPSDERIQVEPKQIHPVEWLHIEGVVPPGSVGGTKEHPGVFSVVDRGKVYFGAVKPYFVEMFLKGRKFNGRWVVRLVPNGLYWTIHKPKDQMPYVLSRRAVDKGWMPPRGVSALPPEIREQIPKEYRYWLVKDPEKAREVRDKLVEAIRKGEVEIKVPEKWLGTGGEFVLQYQWWRGPIVVRGGPSKQRWILWLGNEAYTLLTDPLTSTAVATQVDFDARWREHEGPVEPGTELNPTKETPSEVKVIDRGRYEVLEETDLMRRMLFDGELLKGQWVLEREDPRTDLWVFYWVEEKPGVKNIDDKATISESHEDRT